jgi:thiosulfate dehydrogenase [quinone] large subunit
MILKDRKRETLSAYSYAGLFTLSLRLVVGWTYFSAFLRRLILDNKLDPNGVGYVGEKFNHFLPNALGIKPVIEYLLVNPNSLWWSMLFFTIIEGIVGLFFMLGFFTRLMSIGVFGLAMCILLGSGWLGTTCLDEWQIGILGIAAGFTVFLSGGGKYAIDSLVMAKIPNNKFKEQFNFLTSGDLSISSKAIHKIVFPASLFILFIALFTNQYFHNGIWGPLHNKSVKPKIEISNASIVNDKLSFTVFRVEGVDVYGSFLIGITLKDENGKTLINKNGEDLSRFSKDKIENRYIAQVKPGKHSLIIPLGSKADIKIQEKGINSLPRGKYKLILTDISGITWVKMIDIKK